MSKQVVNLEGEVWRTAELKSFFHCGNTKIWEVVNEDGFPKPFFCGRGKMWLAKDVRSWVQRKADEANTQRK